MRYFFKKISALFLLFSEIARGSWTDALKVRYSYKASVMDYINLLPNTLLINRLRNEVRSFVRYLERQWPSLVFILARLEWVWVWRAFFSLLLSRLCHRCVKNYGTALLLDYVQSTFVWWVFIVFFFFYGYDLYQDQIPAINGLAYHFCLSLFLFWQGRKSYDASEENIAYLNIFLFCLNIFIGPAFFLVLNFNGTFFFSFQMALFRFYCLVTLALTFLLIIQFPRRKLSLAITTRYKTKVYEMVLNKKMALVDSYVEWAYPFQVAWVIVYGLYFFQKMVGLSFLIAPLFYASLFLSIIVFGSAIFVFIFKLYYIIIINYRIARYDYIKKVYAGLREKLC